MSIEQLLQKAIERQASDLHLVAGQPPLVRVHGELEPLGEPAMDGGQLEELLLAMSTESHKEQFLRNKEIDFSYFCLDGYQFRVNLYFEKRNMAATIRITSTDIKEAGSLRLPSAIDSLAMRRKGMIILCGTAGSGKSTTLTWLIDKINRTRKSKVITIEDPIEFIHKSKKSLIVQREVGSDTHSFAAALKYALRQDPDVVVVGEMRDVESISMALTTAETGHLVLTTLHAPDTIETINRIIDACPTERQDQIRVQLAENLEAVIGQTLIPRKDSAERVLATEVLISNMAIKNLIRRGAFAEIRSQMESDKDLGMHTFEQSFQNLVKEGVIAEDTAREYAKRGHFLQF